MSTVDIKILTYNCWHALAPKNLIQFRDLEASNRKIERYLVQLENLKKLNADIVFLQEVSPIQDRASDFEKLGYDVCYQVDQSGLKFFGVGLPTNLSTGLVILAKPEFNLKKLFGQKLSGNPGFTGVNFSFQITENRFALFASTEHPQFGRSLLICTHLHHGTEGTALLESTLTKALENGTLSIDEIEVLRSEVRTAELRRKNELEILFSAAQVFEKKFDQIILAGDLNSSETSSVYNQVLFQNYIDTYRNKNIESDKDTYQGFTWDKSVNKENIQFGHGFDLPMSSFGRHEIRELFHTYNDRSRRIDFIFLKNLSSGRSTRIMNSKLLNIDSHSKQLFGSDHLAVLTELSKGRAREI